MFNSRLPPVRRTPARHSGADSLSPGKKVSIATDLMKVNRPYFRPNRLTQHLIALIQPSPTCGLSRLRSLSDMIPISTRELSATKDYHNIHKVSSPFPCLTTKNHSVSPVPMLPLWLDNI